MVLEHAPQGSAGQHSYVSITTPFLFLLEALGPDEVEMGRNAVGPTGRKFTNMLPETIDRRWQTVANVVRCRPVQWEACNVCGGDGVETADGEGPCVDCGGKGQRPSRLEYNNDHRTIAPSPGQVRECLTRYGHDLFERYEGGTIVALGKTALQAFTDHVHNISNVRGNIWEHGENIDCEACHGEGKVEGRRIKCKVCRGREILKCLGCGGVTKHRKNCISDWVSCGACFKGTISGKPKKCPACSGEGSVPKDPGKPYVCERLKSGQILFATYHPSYVNHHPPAEEIVVRDLARLPNLRHELESSDDLEHHIYPGAESTPWIDTAERLSIDLETSGGFNPAHGDIRCWGATHRTGFGAVFYPDDVRLDRALRCREIVGQNFVLYDQWWLHQKGFHIPDTTRIVDTRYLGKLLNPDTPNDLVYLTGKYANPPIRSYWKTKTNYRDRIEEVCAIDVDTTLRVYHGQKQTLLEEGRWGIVENYIIPLSRVLFDMRVGGMKIDQSTMDQTREDIERQLLEIRAELPWDDASENQSGRIQHFLYNDLHLPVLKKDGRPTANRAALEEIANRLRTDHSSVRKVSEDDRTLALQTVESLLHARQLSKLSNSFLKYKLDGTSLIHPALNMGGSARGKHESGRGTATWRFSCTDPNAQQVPKSARGLFVPDHPDWEIASVDLKQAEVVGFLWYAEAWEVLKNVLIHGFDAHSMVADAIGLERDDAKNTTFAILYGESERTTAARTGRSIDAIKQVREAYFKALPGVEEYRRAKVAESQKRGFVSSPFDFRRFVVAESTKGRAANMVCNMPIQNIPPIVIGRSMIGIHRELPVGRILMQVHDELVLTYPKDQRRRVLECVVDWMRRPVPELSAPALGMASGLRFNLDIAVGPNWGEMEDYE